MTARFAYRRPKPPAKVPAAGKPRRSPALPAASLPKDPLPAQKGAFKEVCVFNAGGVGRTTIAIPMGEYEHMLSFAGESVAAVESACVAASLILKSQDGDTCTEAVAGGAMLALMEAYHSKRKFKPGRSTT